MKRNLFIISAIMFALFPIEKYLMAGIQELNYNISYAILLLAVATLSFVCVIYSLTLSINSINKGVCTRVPSIILAVTAGIIFGCEIYYTINFFMAMHYLDNINTTTVLSYINYLLDVIGLIVMVSLSFMNFSNAKVNEGIVFRNTFTTGGIVGLSIITLKAIMNTMIYGSDYIGSDYNIGSGYILIALLSLLLPALIVAFVFEMIKIKNNIKALVPEIILLATSSTMIIIEFILFIYNPYQAIYFVVTLLALVFAILGLILAIKTLNVKDEVILDETIEENETNTLTTPTINLEDTKDVLETIKRLKELLDNNAISKDEYDVLKAKELNKL